MKKVFKILVVGFLSLVVVSMVSAGGGNEKSGGSAADGKALNFVYVSQGSGSPGTYDYEMRRVAEKYTQETGIGVNSEFYAFNDLFQIIEVKIASGSKDYDIIAVDVPMVAGYVNRGYLAPVDTYYSAEEKARFIPSALAAGSWNGVFYSPPVNTSSQVLYYNKGLLDQAGVQVRPSDVNNRLTYEEVADMAKQAIAKLDPNHTNGIIGLQFHQVSRTYQMNMLPNSLGEKNIGPDGFTVDGVINTPGWTKALTWYQQLYRDGLSLRGYTAEETMGFFISGKILFYIGTTTLPARLQGSSVNWGFAPVPAFKGYEDKVGTPTGSWHVGINQASTKKDLAAGFVKYITLGEGNSLFCTGTSQIPANKNAIDLIEKDPNANPVMKIAVYEAVHTAVPRALTPGYPEYSTVIDSMWEDVRNGANIKSALDKAVLDINSAMTKYK
jgi:ABC-type glycerol-3-phosphate transport system substrate-binding protein